MPQTGIYITFAGFHILLASRLQIDVELSTIEAQYTALSTAMQGVILMVRMLKDIWKTIDFKVF